MQRLRFGRVLVLAGATALLGLVPPASGAQAPECLIEVHDQNGAITDGRGRCEVQPAGAKFCTFNLQLCHNVGSCSADPLKGKARTTGHCNPGKLTVLSTDSSCGMSQDIKVRTKGNHKNPGSCKIRVQAHAGHGQKDVDKVTLTCVPAGTPCPASPSGAFLDRADTP